jgi:DNA polymerase-1
MPDDLVSQLPHIKEIVNAYNIATFELAGYEADDILATIAKKAEEAGTPTLIATGDKDALQIVSSCIKVYDAHKDNAVYDEAKVEERFGVKPSAVVDVMALMGDSSDNIPGVPGIGEKGAVELIKKFGTLENLLSHLDEVESKAKRELLERNAKLAQMSKELATLDSEVPIELTMRAIKLDQPDTQRLLALFRKFDFKSLVNQVATRTELEATYQLIDTQEKFHDFMKKLKAAREFVFDFETTGSDPMTAEPIGVSFCWKEAEARYVAFSDRGPLTKDYVFGELRQLFEDPAIKKIGQNIKYELLILMNNGIRVGGVAFDTMIASYLLNPSKLNHNLEDISLEYLNHKMISITELIGKGKKQRNMKEVDVQRVCAYSCEDSDVTYRLKNILHKEIIAKELDELFYNVEMPLVAVLATMECNGVCIDRALLEELGKDMGSSLKKMEAEIYRQAGEEFNINSPKQLSGVLYDKLKLPVVKRTKTGISTDEWTLKRLATHHELPNQLLTFRELAKLKSTYVDNLPKLINPRTHRVHTSFNQTVTATGRLSSSEPNLQNIPIKTELGKSIRKVFIPTDSNNAILSCDYSQIELRVLAHLSGDKALIKAFQKDMDIHTYTASLVFGVDEDDVDQAMRSTAKTVNFGIVYGMSAFGLSRDLSIDIEEARNFIDAYFARYKQVKEYIDDCITTAKKQGYVTTIMNRRRYIPEINSEDIRVRQFAERTAINTPIQGSAADIIKVAMIKVARTLEEEELQTNMMLQVHDELVFDVPAFELERAKELVKTCMEGVIDLDVPIKANVAVGNNWLEMQ